MKKERKTLLFLTIMTTLTIAIIVLWALTSPLFTNISKEGPTIWERVQQLTN